MGLVGGFDVDLYHGRTSREPDAACERGPADDVGVSGRGRGPHHDPSQGRYLVLKVHESLHRRLQLLRLLAHAR